MPWLRRAAPETSTFVAEVTPRLKGTALGTRVPFAEFGPWSRGTAHEVHVPVVEIVPWLRGTALETRVPVAGTMPREFATDDVGARGLVTEANIAALLDGLATGIRASCETNGGAPDSAGGERAGCAVPPSSCHLPVRKVPGWRAFGFPLGLWVAARRIPRAGAEPEEAVEGGTPQWWPNVYGLPRLAL